MNQLISALLRLAFLQRQNLDKNALQNELESGEETSREPKHLLQHLQKTLRWTRVDSVSTLSLDPSQLPCLALSNTGEWRILKSFNSQSQWVSESHQTETTHSSLASFSLFKINFQIPFDRTASPVWHLIKAEIFQHKQKLIDASLSGVMLNVVALAITFYSMQVYDRVIPTSASATLLVLSLGVLGAILFEWFSRKVRSDLNESIVEHVDQRLGREVFLKFLNIRLDKLPQSVGSLTGQLKAYESVRAFLTNSAAQMLIDAPFALLFLVAIASIAGWLALIPMLFLVISLWIGLKGLKEIEHRSQVAMLANMRKTGILVEAIEGAETLKSGQGGWRQLSLCKVFQTQRAQKICDFAE
jgi:ATP-binding cassette subfamily C protein LapB